MSKDSLDFEFREDAAEGPSLWVNGWCFVRGMRWDGTSRLDERVYKTIHRGLVSVAEVDKRVTVS